MPGGGPSMGGAPAGQGQRRGGPGMGGGPPPQGQMAQPPQGQPAP